MHTCNVKLNKHIPHPEYKTLCKGTYQRPVFHTITQGPRVLPSLAKPLEHASSYIMTTKGKLKECCSLALKFSLTEVTYISSTHSPLSRTNHMVSPNYKSFGQKDMDSW